MKIFLGVFFIFLSSFTQAQNNPIEGQGALEACKDCQTPAASPLPAAFVSDAKDLLASINNSFHCEPGSDPNNCLLIDWLKWKHQSYAKNCKEFFLDEQGNLGKFSKITATLIAEDVKNYGDQSKFVQTNSDFDRLCPNFKNFTTTQKIAFHSWIFELLAFPESTCNINVKPNLAAPTTKAVCLYQLEDRPEIRKWRSNQYKFKPPRCAVSAAQILTIEGCTGCAFDEYKRKTIKDGSPFGVLNAQGKRTSGAYWASHNPLSSSQEACLEKYLDPKTGKPLMSGKKPTYLLKCAKSNNEWMPRYKFFRRLQRFPLCGTAMANSEIDDLKAYQSSH